MSVIEKRKHQADPAAQSTDSASGSRGGRMLRLLPLGLALLLVAAAAALFITNQRHEQDAEGAEDARALGTTRVEELLSYDYRRLDEEAAEERKWLTGDFAEVYSPLISDEFVALAEENKLVTQARVAAGGIETVDGDEVDLVLFVNVEIQRAQQPAAVTGTRLRVTLQHVDGDWLIDALDPI